MDILLSAILLLGQVNTTAQTITTNTTIENQEFQIPANSNTWFRSITVKGPNPGGVPIKVKIKNCKFDGNVLNQTWAGGNELEHQAGIFCQGVATVDIENCTFINSAGAGIANYTDATVNIRNCTFTDIFMGGINVTGKNNYTNIDSCYGWSSGAPPKGYSYKNGLDVEPTGFVEVIVTNSIFGYAEIGGTDEHVTFTKCKIGGVPFKGTDFFVANYAPNSTLVMNNCEILGFSDYQRVGNMTFNRCSFNWARFLWQAGSSKYTKQTLYFHKCSAIQKLRFLKDYNDLNNMAYLHFVTSPVIEVNCGHFILDGCTIGQIDNLAPSTTDIITR